MRYAKESPISRQDEIDGVERMMRAALPDGAKAMAVWESFEGDVEEVSELWARFEANERSAMKERREVRPGRKRENPYKRRW